MPRKTTFDYFTQTLTPEIREKRESKKSRILSALMASGVAGVLNTELNKISFRYSACIHELRKEGHRITSQPDSIDGTLWRFTLHEKGK